MRSLLNHLLLVVVVLLVSACGPAAEPPAASQPEAGGFTTISVADLKTRLDGGEPPLVLDVRSPEEFAQDGHIAGATLIPLPELGQRMGELQQDQAIACFCRSGNRSRTACEQLAQAGFTNLVNVDGGIGAWTAAGYPTE